MSERDGLRSQNKKRRTSFLQKCVTCDGNINNNDLFLKCCDCVAAHHIQCVNVDKKKYDKIKNKNNWFCPEHDEEDDDTEEYQQQIGKKLDNIVKQLKDITKSQEFLASKHDDVIDQLQQIREENKGARKEIASLKKQQQEMRKEIDELKAKVNIFEQYKTGDKIIVRGISKNEKATEAIQKIAGIVGVDLSPNDIVFANQSTAENKTPNITAKFSNQQKKVEFLKAVKSKRLSTQMYGYDGDSKPIYADEQLTKYTYTLFTQAKDLKKVGIKHVWVSNGDVLYRQNDDSQTKRIHSSFQIKEIEKAIMLSKHKATNTMSRKQSQASRSNINKNKANKNDKRKQTHESEDDDNYAST